MSDKPTWNWGGRPPRVPDEMIGSKGQVLRPWGKDGYQPDWAPVPSLDLRDNRDPELLGYEISDAKVRLSAMVPNGRSVTAVEAVEFLK